MGTMCWGQGATEFECGSRIEVAARAVISYCDAIAEAYDYGVEVGPDVEPWQRPFAASFVHALARALPESFVRSVAAHFEEAIEERRSLRRERELGPSPFFAFLQHVVSVERELHGPRQPAARVDGIPIDRAPSVIPYGPLAALTAPEGLRTLRIAAERSTAQCSTSQRSTAQGWTAACSDAECDVATPRTSLPAPGFEEVQILRALAAGEKVVDLAVRLGYSQRTVYRRLSRVWRELGVSSTVEGIAAATRAGWLDQPSESERHTSAKGVVAGSFYGIH